MSTPDRKAGEAYRSFRSMRRKDTYERANLPKTSSKSRAMASPFAPLTRRLRARERASAERHPKKLTTRSILSRYAPKKARATTGSGPRMPTHLGDGAPLYLSRARTSARTFRAPCRRRQRIRYLASPAQSAQHEQTGATRRDAGIPDLKRLEATLRWIQRRKRPRGSLAPPSYQSSGLLPPMSKAVVTAARCWIFERRARWSQKRMLPPPTMRSPRRLARRCPLITLFASIVAAPIGYYFSTGDWSPSFAACAPDRKWHRSVRKPMRGRRPIGQQELPQTMAQDDDRAGFAQSEVSSQRPETFAGHANQPKVEPWRCCSRA